MEQSKRKRCFRTQYLFRHEAQLSQTDRATLRVIEYLSKSLKNTRKSK